MLQKIIDFFKSLFGGKKNNAKIKPVSKPIAPKPTPPSDPDPTPSPPPKPEPPKSVEKIQFDISGTTLFLGCFDDNANQNRLEELLKIYHKNMTGVANNVRFKKFRHGDLFGWVDPKKVSGNPVKNLQLFLRHIGILPDHSKADGIFDYTTQAAVRLFQEYIRTIEGDASIGTPDGVIGKNGWKHIKRWMDEGKTASEWAHGQHTSEYNKWLGLLSKAKVHYQSSPHDILDKVNAKVDQIGATNVDTLKTSDWKTDANQIHLIGIRRKEGDNKGLRQNDDVFILLVGGLVFKFWGSTDPNHGKKVRKDEAFLVEGQHKFRFGWHNRSEKNQAKVYQGLNPLSKGVLVFRDRDNDNKLTHTDIQSGGIDNEANNTINIHWTGSGKGPSGTWSHGCQVIAGNNYINHKGELIDCSAFSASGSVALKNNRSAVSLSKTKGAYNMFTDLILLYGPKEVDFIYFTLGRDETFNHKFVVDLAGGDMLSDTLKVFKLPEMDV